MPTLNFAGHVAYGAFTTSTSTCLGRLYSRGRLDNLGSDFFVLSAIGGALAAAVLPTPVSYLRAPRREEVASNLARQIVGVMATNMVGVAFGVKLEAALFGRSELGYESAVISAFVGSVVTEVGLVVLSVFLGDDFL